MIAILNTLSATSWKTIYSVSDFLSFLLHKVIRYRKTIVVANLRNSFPEKSEKELKELTRAFYRHFADLIMETIKLRNTPLNEIGERLVLATETRDYLNSLQTGAVVVLGHRGNWELANLYASSHLRPEPITVYKPLANPGFERWFQEMRTRFGAVMVPMKQIYSELEKPRANPYLVFLVNDQSPNPTSAYWTRFLHQDTGIFRGAETIARTCDIPILFGDILRMEARRGYYLLELSMLSENPGAEPPNRILERQIRKLEEQIYKQPANWLWSHKRWKHKKPEVLKPEQLLGN